MGPILTIDDFLDMLRRRSGLLLAICGLGVIASVVFALSQPHRYTSFTVLQIERPRVSSDLAATTVEGSSARRLQQIEQKLMARSAVLDMIARYDLFTDLPALSELQRVALFRDSVTIEGVAAAREGMAEDGTVSALTISAAFGSPEKAQMVANALGRRTIELSLEARRARTEAALAFFTTEEQALLRKIAAAEAEIARFSSQNELAIGGEVEVRQEQIGILEQAIIAVQQNRITVQREIDQLTGESTRPATLRRLSELQRDLTALDEQRDFLRERLAQFRQSLTAAPEVERQIGLLRMQIERFSEQLEDISARRVEAEIGQRLEDLRQAERIEILETAYLPEDPSSPSRRKIALLGAVASMAAAFGAALLLEMRHPVIRSAEQMQRELGYLPAICIPQLDAKPRARRARLAETIRRGTVALALWAGRAIWKGIGRLMSRWPATRRA